MPVEQLTTEQMKRIPDRIRSFGFRKIQEVLPAPTRSVSSCRASWQNSLPAKPWRRGRAHGGLDGTVEALVQPLLSALAEEAFRFGDTGR